MTLLGLSLILVEGFDWLSIESPVGTPYNTEGAVRAASEGASRLRKRATHGRNNAHTLAWGRPAAPCVLLSFSCWVHTRRLLTHSIRNTPHQELGLRLHMRA